MSNTREASLSAPPTSKSPKRTRRAIPLILAIILAVSLGTGYWWLVNYQPLKYGNQFLAAGASRVDTVSLGTEYKYSFKRADSFELLVEIIHDGPLAVRIQDYERTSAYYYRLAEVEVGVGQGTLRGGAPSDFVDWRPFTLEQGQHAFLRLKYQFADCATEGGMSTWFTSFKLRTTAMWMSKDVEIDLPSPVVVLETGGDCGEEGFFDRDA